MDLIEILWRQDIDLGVERDAYDATRRQELEKQRETELAQHREKEKQLEEKREQKLNNNNVTYITDQETGEVIAVPVNSSQALPADSYVPFTHAAHPDQLLQPQQHQMVPELHQHAQQEQNGEYSMEEAMEILQQSVDDFSLDTPVVAPSNANITEQLNELENMITDVADMYNNGTQQSSRLSPLQHQNSIEQHWQDITNLLPIDGVLSTDNSSTMGELTSLLNEYEANVAVIPENSLIQNTSLVPQLPITNTSFNEGFNYTDLTNITGPINGNLTEFSQLISTEALGLGNSPTLTGNQYINSTESLLQQLLLRDDILDLDLDDLDVTQGASAMEINDTISTGSSSVASASTLNVSDISSESSYELLEGATGGSDEGSMQTKHKYEPTEAYSQANDGDRDLHLNHSVTNATYEADPRQVMHNHSYPLEQGQTPKERKTRKVIKDELDIHDLQYTRDQKRAKSMGVPFTMTEMIESAVEEFNEMLQEHQLTDKQLQLIRDIRRRGKNKVAAQNCRKRKLEVIQALEEEVDKMRLDRDRLSSQRRVLDKEMSGMKQKYNEMYENVFKNLRDDQGHPYDPNEYALQQNDDGEVFLVPHNATSCIKDKPKNKGTRKRKNDRKGH